ncbi:hypothetical protein GCM10009801_67680 [Streptomyces albiaxialis]|uniref:Uncharacterized protein n=1 Tax=Streptomyces albiaxialis TaxID=329523 RepID=A0ABP5IF91_9ACTN
MENLIPVAVGAVIGLLGVVFGSWFTARRQDRMWLREQKLRAGVAFNTAVVELIDHLRETRIDEDGPGRNELAGRMQEARSAIFLLCAEDTVDLADALVRRVWKSRPSEDRADLRAEHHETLAHLRRFTRRLREEIART